MSPLRTLLPVLAVALPAALLPGWLETQAGERRVRIDAQQERDALTALLPASLREPDLQLQWHPADPGMGITQTWGTLRNADGQTRAWITIGIAQGYGGQVRIQQLSDPAGTALGWRLHADQETPSYVGALPAHWQSPAAADAQVDQLSGASLSLRAVRTAREDAAAQAGRLASGAPSTPP